MNIEVARTLYHSRYAATYQLEQYMQYLREGLILAQVRQQQTAAGGESVFSEDQKEKLTLALEYNETLMLHLITNPPGPVSK